MIPVKHHETIQWMCRVPFHARADNENHRTAIALVARAISSALAESPSVKPPTLALIEADLDAIATNGASATTASQDGHLAGGVAASAAMAQTDLERVLAMREAIERVGEQYGVPPSVLAAIASRESRGGIALVNGWGDGGNAFGVMQIDKRFHEIRGTDPDGPLHFGQAAEILVNNLYKVRTAHQQWHPRYWLKGAIAAYNAGVSNVRTIERMDVGTTGDDYSGDVVARAQFYSRHFARLTESQK